MCNYETKVFDLHMFEFTFVMSQEELVFTKLCQDQACNAMMFLYGFSVDEDAVEVHTHYSFHNKVLKDLICHCLEDRRTVCKAKEHHQWFEQSMTHPKCSFPLITLFHSHILISPSHIQLCEVLCTMKLTHKVQNETKGVAILDSHCIKGMIILDNA